MFVIASNRLPVVISKDDAGAWQIKSGSGGLVTAIAPVLQKQGGLWIGWSGCPNEEGLDEQLAIASRNTGYTLKPVMLSEEEVDEYYYGFSNGIIWPLFHDFHSRCNFAPEYWITYQKVNKKFAQVIAENTSIDDFVWIHDYHLLLVAEALRVMAAERQIGFFLHTPFPPLDIFNKLPWRREILRALLEYDIIGFQTMRDRNNFVNCVESTIRGCRVDARRQLSTIRRPERVNYVGVFPISIDYNAFYRLATDKTTTKRVAQILEALQNVRIILGVDRMDYSKGIPLRLRAFNNALERFEELRGMVTLIQISTPSREDIPEYQRLKAEVDGLVGEINGKFGRPGWTPVQYMYRNLERPELVAYYSAAEIALVTPLKDGMNLIAKEYCAANIDCSGVLILSEFAGAATQLRKNALVVNPYDIEGVANAIHRAYNMSVDEREMRMRRLRNSIQKRDIYWWLTLFSREVMATQGISLTPLSYKEPS
ncbi:trehalose-6-phosphate synthase [Chloroflexota bacterium]